MLKFGIIPALVGRLPILVTLDSLDEQAMLDILVKPKNALTKQYQHLFRLDNVDLEFEEDALKAIAAKTIERNTGARGLRSVMEGLLTQLMFDVPSDPSIRKVIITKAAVDGTGAPTLIRE